MFCPAQSYPVGLKGRRAKSVSGAGQQRRCDFLMQRIHRTAGINEPTMSYQAVGSASVPMNDKTWLKGPHGARWALNGSNDAIPAECDANKKGLYNPHAMIVRSMLNMETQECQHHWQIEAANGPVSRGIC